jgi:hypothetical protein
LPEEPAAACAGLFLLPFAGTRAVRRSGPAIRRIALGPTSVLVYRPSIDNECGDIMKSEASYHLRRQVLWGLLLVGLGVAFLLDQMDIIRITDLWHYAPLLLVVIGINQTIGYPNAREFSSGLWTVFIGLWLFAVFEGMWGLTFANSWPLFIIITGVTMAVRPIAERRFRGGNGNGK